MTLIFSILFPIRSSLMLRLLFWMLLATVSAVPLAVGSEAGLVATYRDGTTTVARIVPTPHFYLKAGDSIHPQVAPQFDADWQGMLKIERAGRYRLHANADVQLLGKPADDWVQLPTGEHPLSIRFSRDKADQDAQLQLRWESEFFREEPVPSEALTHQNTPAQLAASDAVERGRFLFAEMGCANCHAAKDWQLQSRRGPDLTASGSRLHAGWVYQWLKEPRAYRKSAVMPVCLDSDQDRSDVTAFLATQGPQPLDASGKPLADQLKLGEVTFNQVGCKNCHDKDNDLERVGSKYASIAELADFIAEPHQRDPQGRMPRLFPADDRHLATAVASFLYHSKRGAEKFPPAPAGNPRRGAKLFASHGCANCHSIDTDNQVDVERLVAPAFGQTTGLPLRQYWDFDDGAVERTTGKREKVVGKSTLAPGRAGKAFQFDGNNFIELAHFHRPATMTISVWVKTTRGGSILTWGRPAGGLRGSRELRMNIGQDGKNSICYGEYNSDGGWRPVIVRPTNVNLVDDQWHHLAVVRQDQKIQHYVNGKAMGKPSPSQPDGGDYTDRLLIGALGLQSNPSNRFGGLIDELAVWETALSAEQIAMLASGNSTPLDLSAPAEVKVEPFDVTAGCLSPNVKRPLPDYRLNTADRDALQKFLMTVQPDQPKHAAPLAHHQLLMKQFRCTACHQLDAANIQRATRVTDDGEIVQVERPPILTGAGAKLTSTRLHEVLLDGRRNRPWLNLRMPHFGPAIAALPGTFTASAGLSPHHAAPKPNKELAAAGLKLIGQQRGKASCITCHNYRGINRRKDGVVPAPDLAEAGGTVRRDWFERWMHDPQRLQPGTSMPQFFLDVSPEERQLNIDRLWSAIYFQSELPLPEGVLTKQTEGTRIVVKDRPVIFRMATITPVGQIDRAINVGIPGGYNFTFDPVKCQLKYAWKGEFMDAGPAWNGRGGNPVRAGSDALAAVKTGHYLTLGDGERRVKFLGYRLVDGLPVFRYRLNNATVEHQVTVSDEGVFQTMRVQGSEQAVRYQDSPDLRAVSETKDGVVEVVIAKDGT